MAIDRVFGFSFLFGNLFIFFLEQVKEEKGLNVWMFIWTTEFNKLLTNFKKNTLSVLPYLVCQ